MKNEFKHRRIGPIPAMRSIISLVAKTVVSQIRAKIIKNRVFRTIGKEIKIESRREASDVNPTIITMFRKNFRRGNVLGEIQLNEKGKEIEKEEENGNWFAGHDMEVN